VTGARRPGEDEPPRPSPAGAAAAFLAAHQAGPPLILPNVWDVASARVVEEAGFPFLATSSHAIAAVLGGRDDDSAEPAVVFPFLARIAASVRAPVTADLERGYRLPPSELVERVLTAGLIGCNLEDTDHHGEAALVDLEEQCAFLTEVRVAADSAGVHLVVNARVDTVIRRVGDERSQLDEAIRRGRRYLDAGADCVYPIGLSDPDAIRELVTAMPGPVNILARPGGPPVAQLADLGVRRISFGGGLHRRLLDHLRELVAGIPTSTS
jgi:2-methylisocitrate lyase-like PEP mutase family enzyme